MFSWIYIGTLTNCTRGIFTPSGGVSLISLEGLHSGCLTSLEGLRSLSDCVVCWYPRNAWNGLKEVVQD